MSVALKMLSSKVLGLNIAVFWILQVTILLMIGRD